MNVEYGKISFARSSVEAAENEFLSSGNIPQSEILRGRADENQVVVLGVVERKQGSALHAQRAIKQFEDVVELMDGEHFAYAGVMIKNKSARVGCGIEVAHASFRPADKTAVAEDHPRLLRAGREAIPKNLIDLGDGLTGGGLRLRALREQNGGGDPGRQEQHRQNHGSGGQPALRGRGFFSGRCVFKREGNW